MYRAMMLVFAAAVAVSPVLAQQPAAPAAPAAAPAAAAVQPGREVPLARVMTDGATLRGVDSKDRLVLQLGKFIFLCRHGDGKPATCDVVN